MSKLLLIIALSILSFARLRPVVKAADAVSLYYHNEAIDSTGKVTIGTAVDQTAYSAKIAINTLKPLDRVTKPDADAFQVITDAKFKTLLTTASLSPFEEACTIVNEAYNNGQYLLYGYSAWLYAQKDLKPSITGLVINSPISVGSSSPAKTCKTYDNDYLTYGLYAEGLVGADCIANIEGDIPDNGTKCYDYASNAAVDYVPVLKGYREGNFFGLKAAAVKDLIIRFGVAIVVDGGYVTPIIGWKKVLDKDSWVYVSVDEQNRNILDTEEITTPETTTYKGFVLFDDKALDGCLTLSAETTADACPCPTDKESPEYEADPRTGKKGICAAGTMRAAWAVVVAVLAVPALSLFW